MSVKAGSEAASPSAPSADSGNLELAQIYLPVGAAHIDDTNGGDGYITDTRSFI